MIIVLVYWYEYEEVVRYTYYEKDREKIVTFLE